MNKKEFDQKLKDTLFHETDEIVYEKERIKRALDAQLFGKKQKKKRPMGIVISSAAACLLLIAGLQTESGYAFVDKIKEWFAPEKDITIQIEGTEEENHVTLHEKASRYVVYLEEERYKIMKNEKGNDVVTTKEPLGVAYPEVSMEIIHETSSSKETLIRQIEDGLTAKHYTIVSSNSTTEPREGYVIYATAQEVPTWNTPVEKVFLMDGGAGDWYIFKQKYFTEAEEGHGARLDAVIKEFHLIP